MAAKIFLSEEQDSHLFMVDKSVENLKSQVGGICVRENLEKSGNFTEKNQNDFLYIFFCCWKECFFR